MGENIFYIVQTQILCRVLSNSVINFVKYKLFIVCLLSDISKVKNNSPQRLNDTYEDVPEFMQDLNFFRAFKCYKKKKEAG